VGLGVSQPQLLLISTKHDLVHPRPPAPTPPLSCRLAFSLPLPLSCSILSLRFRSTALSLPLPLPLPLSLSLSLSQPTASAVVPRPVSDARAQHISCPSCRFHRPTPSLTSRPLLLAATSCADSPPARTTVHRPPSSVHPLQPRAAAHVVKIPSSHITHEARTSLLSGQPQDRPFPTQYQPYGQQPAYAPTGGYHEREGFPTELPPPTRRRTRMVRRPPSQDAFLANPFAVYPQHEVDMGLHVDGHYPGHHRPHSRIVRRSVAPSPSAPC